MYVGRVIVGQQRGGVQIDFGGDAERLREVAERLGEGLPPAWARGVTDAVRAGRVQVTPTLPYKVAMGAMKIAPRWVTARAMRAGEFRHELVASRWYTRSRMVV